MTDHPVSGRPLSHWYTRPRSRSRRESSWDRTGHNDNWVTVRAGDTVTLLDARGPGCITHLYAAMIMPAVTDYRDAIVRCYWDGADVASVEVPLGDLFGVAHARIRTMSSELTSINPGFGLSHGLNAYFPMPFADRAVITIENRGPSTLGGPLEALWYHVDYEVYDDPLPTDTTYFHARYAQVPQTTPAVPSDVNVALHDHVNLSDADNYVALDTRGTGRMVGLVLEIDNTAGGWYGEGDDMVVIDDHPWPPALHGTGTEEIFGGGGCPNREYAGRLTGFHMMETETFDGLVGMYRWFVPDPIAFSTSLRWSVEHGHANNFANGYASVAYWYQDPVVAASPDLPGREELLPRLDGDYAEVADLLLTTAWRLREAGRADDFRVLAGAGRDFYEGGWTTTLRRVRDALTRIEAL